MFSYIFHYSASGSRDTLLLSAYLGVTHGVVSVIVGLVIGVGEGVCVKIVIGHTVVDGEHYDEKDCQNGVEDHTIILLFYS